MVTRSHSPALDPAADAAALLRRIGFATLVVAVPVAALVTRRAAVVLAPIGVALLVMAALLDGQAHMLAAVRRIMSSRAGMAGLILLGWAALSLIWTRFPDTAANKLFNIIGATVLVLAGTAALPERVRAANLYLTGIGAAAAAVFAIAVFLLQPDEENISAIASLERGLTGLSVMIWPALAWLVSRQRNVLSLALAAVAVLAMLVGTVPVAFVAFALGAFIFGLSSIRPRTGVAVVAWGMAAAVALAPVIPFIAQPIVKTVLGTAHPLTESLRAWTMIVRAEPMRLITGHGLDASLRGRVAGEIPANTPVGLPFEVWYELGVVGAAALAVGLFWAARRASFANPVLVPGIMAAFTASFMLACLGVGSAIAWWVTTMSIAVIAFVAIERGQFRTSRPKARLWTAANDR
ncbi:peptide ABC transporter permease [Chelatococcus sp. GCM10030263]|uniref:peptide ABC transporter permease n=1 Tax=Chelatococcus sp. GCM10030263 TaxID=3273387 RepID=UPI003606CC1F